MEPASIRFKNPGAMWGYTGHHTPGVVEVVTNAPIPKKWGSTKTVYLNDGLGQGNNIAVFDNWVDGICAQLDLWRTSPNYRNKRFADAINTWDGHNNTPSYIAYVKARVPGMTENTVMDDAFWRGPMAIPFLKAQSGHEAGRAIPAPDADWIEAQRRVMSGVIPSPVQPIHKKTAVVIASAGTAGAAAHAAGANHVTVAVIVIAVAVIAIVGLVIHNRATA